jgi:sucrose phosphorylase
MRSDHDVSSGPILNAYPDSIGGTLKDVVSFLKSDAVRGAFSTAYILPSLFNTDLDRGFSVIDYTLNELYASPADLEEFQALGVELKLDFILNHASVLSPQFCDLIQNGDASESRDFFINWNRFWDGHGKMTAQGYIQPDEAEIRDMFFRKPGLPLLMVRFPDGRSVPYWNTFYQSVRYPRLDAQDVMRVSDLQYAAAEKLADVVNFALDAGQAPDTIDLGQWEHARAGIAEYLEMNRKYLGQMDVNIQSAQVWKYYAHTLKTLAGYGARIIRLDAFAYAHKAPGRHNFLNEPETWELLAKVRNLADEYGLTLLPEIHASYARKTYQKIAEQGYLTYDFFLPGLILDALEHHDGSYLAAWALEQTRKGIRTVNMLGCHDGIPLLDLEGLLPDGRIQQLIDTVVGRGGMVKDLHGQKNVYYQVNATYFSALGEDERKMLLARALQMFMPGKPQVWYLDLFLGRNDLEAVRRGGSGGHKEINRTNLSARQAEDALVNDTIIKQLELLRFRNTCTAFGFDAQFTLTQHSAHQLTLQWENKTSAAALHVDLKDVSYQIISTPGDAAL